MAFRPHINSAVDQRDDVLLPYTLILSSPSPALFPVHHGCGFHSSSCVVVFLCHSPDDRQMLYPPNEKVVQALRSE